MRNLRQIRAIAAAYASKYGGRSIAKGARRVGRNVKNYVGHDLVNQEREKYWGDVLSTMGVRRSNSTWSNVIDNNTHTFVDYNPSQLRKDVVKKWPLHRRAAHKTYRFARSNPIPTVYGGLGLVAAGVAVSPPARRMRAEKKKKDWLFLRQNSKVINQRARKLRRD